ncbi:MAG TPA: hypothetical protein ENF51_00135, partial [Candidatus Aenigmarchaeota archaeon]|nr:hypothetical protein [Candidatus Aenigmarchaeota archaeon]
MIVSQDEELRKALQRNPHLKEYLRKGAREFGTPKFVKTLDRSMADERDINIIYPVGDPVFIHIFRQSNGELLYRVVEPFLSEKEKELMVKVRHASVGLASDYEKEPETKEEHEKILKDLIRRVTSTGLSLRERLRKLFLGSEKVLLSEETLKKITYYLIRDLVYMGRIQPFLMDPYLEDVSSIGTHGIFVYHKYFGSIKTDSRFESLRELDRYLTELASAIDKRLSLGEPILDGNLYEGSRVNIIYGTDVSRRGSSFSIRKFEALPFSITQLIDMNTLSAEEAAYLWLCIENGMNIFFCGEAASGKTTTLRAATVFIKPNDKIYSVEDTPELKVLHKNWQRLLTKEKRAEPFDLVKASLRSRPDYIIVGEI